MSNIPKDIAKKHVKIVAFVRAFQKMNHNEEGFKT